MKVVDSGINYDFEGLEGLTDLKVRKGTRNYLHEAAMTREEYELCIERGAQVVDQCFDEGSNIISFGEMGIGNTSSSSMWMTYFTGIDLQQCVGAGCGFDSEGVKRKYSILKQALDNYSGDGSTIDIMCYFGGYEMVMAVGAMLRAAELKMVILIDGFIMTNCILAASKLYPEVLEYCIFGHQGDEAGHKLVLDYLIAKPLLFFDLRLGEGTGAVCAYPLVESAVRMINEMNTFQHARVTKYFE
jgi:nicotinate-nucleotide--dimethylbenzimidazole phosphoribosyltransferase